jgi:hypothetical protein
MPLSPSEVHQTNQRRRNPQPTSLSEDASLEEHGEFILYYYDHSLHYSRDGVRHVSSISKEVCQMQEGDESNTSNCTSREMNPPSDYATEDAVRFAGICRALRSLPQALQPQNILSDGSNSCSPPGDEVPDALVVHLTNSTLVFVPLELGGDIIAIAQIPRVNRKLDHSQRYIRFGADPSAITKSIRQIHAVFSIMFGGGIHRRLLRSKHLERSNDIDSIHDNDGMPTNYSDTLIIEDDTIQELATPNGLNERVESSSLENIHLRNSGWKLQKLSTSIFNREAGKQNSLSGDDYRYDGVEKLFNLRREHRKLMCELRYASGANDSVIEIADTLDGIVNDVELSDWERRRRHCEDRIHSLLKRLPITKLREDLVKFFDKWLFEMQDVSEIIQGGVGRCVVDMVPSPIRRGQICSAISDSARGQHPPFLPNPSVSHAAADFMKSMLFQEVPKLMGRNDTSTLSGMSFFHQNRHILSECVPNNDGQEELKGKSACMIVEYFRSNQKNCNDNNNKYDSTPDKITENDDNEALFVRWMSNLSTRGEETTDNTNMQSSSPPGNGRTSTDGSYVEHPSPVSNTDGYIISLFIHNIKQHVWVQRVHLSHTPSYNTTDDDEETETYAAMFEHPEFIFILFFDRPRSEGDWALPHNIADHKTSTETNGKSNQLVGGTTQIIVDILCFLEDKLTTFCKSFSSHTVDPALITPIEDRTSQSSFQGVAGMDIICIDTDKNSFILMSQHDLSSNEFHRTTHKVSKVDDNNSPFKSIQKLFSNSPKSKDTISRERYATARPPLPPSKYTNMLDCRHKLAAYLPLEIIIALDDMFNEMRCLSSHYENYSPMIEFTAHPGNDDDCIKPTARKSKEMCTYLPQGWVWGRSMGNIELYIILDTGVFATINHVQKAVTRVQEHLIPHIS